jgi:hypothetical protein
MFRDRNDENVAPPSIAVAEPERYTCKDPCSAHGGALSSRTDCRHGSSRLVG